MEKTNVKVTVIAKGSLIVEGIHTVITKDGEEEIREEKSFLCRCGHSRVKPYCDGSHTKWNFQD